MLMTVTTPNTVSPLSSSMLSSSSSSTSTCCMSTHKQNTSLHCSHLISPHYKHNHFQANVAHLLPNISSAKPLQDTWFSPHLFSFGVFYWIFVLSKLQVVAAQDHPLCEFIIIFFWKKEQVKLLYSSYTDTKAQHWLLNWERQQPGFSVVDSQWHCSLFPFFFLSFFSSISWCTVVTHSRLTNSRNYWRVQINLMNTFSTFPT